MEFQAFLGPSGQARDPQWNSELTRNLIPIQIRPPGKGRPGQWALQGTPGLRLFLDLGNADALSLFYQGACDLFEHDGRVYAASRTYLYELFEDGTATQLGAIDGSSGFTHFSSAGDLSDEILVVADGRGFILNTATNVVTEITDPEFPSDPVGSEYVDGYFILSQRNSLQFNLSDLLNGTAWSGLDAAEKSTTSDRIMRIKENNGLLWIFGRKRTELWHNDGDPSFPWTPVDNVIINQGLAALDAVCLVGIEEKVLAWLGADGEGGPIAYKAVGYRPQRISDDRVEHVWAEYDKNGGVEDARAFGYQLDGNAFWVCTFPTQDKTWVCNLTTGLWHEWSFFDSLNALHTATLARSHIYAWGKHLVGGRIRGVMELDANYGIDASNLIIRTRRAPYISSEDYNIVHSRIAFDIRSGHHLDGNFPPGTATLTFSDDAGSTWGNPLQRDLAPTGQHVWPIEFHGLGMSSKGRGYELNIGSYSPVSITGCYIDVEKVE